MAATGVLPFVRGIDLTKNDFSEEFFPKAVAEMTGLRWIRLNRAQIEWIPDELGNLQKLETLSLVRNHLVTLHGEIPALPNLRYLNCRRNKINNSGVPGQLFELEDLSVVDLSYNDLKEIPENLETAKGLLVLNLSHNHIDNIPQQLFVNLVDLLHLDLSGNRLTTLPPQMRRLVSLQTLILDDNQLGHYQLRQLPSLTKLKVLRMRNTQRTLQNTPVTLDMGAVLSEVDFSHNSLPKIPDFLYTLNTLKRLNMSDNQLTEILPTVGDLWKSIEVLNLSRNKLKTLPSSLCRCTTLKRLYVNDNFLDFEGFPSGIGKLHNLEVLHVANNNIEMIPESIVRCGRLKKLILSNNRLITLPEAIHLLTDLKTLEVENNPEFVMPPKPQEMQKGAGIEFYNIDFSLNTQLRLAGQQVPVELPAPTPQKDPIARKNRLRRRAENTEADSDQAKILKGMKDIAKNKNSSKHARDEPSEPLKPKRWDESLEKPPLDYSEIFEEDIGQMPGIFVWEIDNFLPNPLDDDRGEFFSGDCYIILRTFIDESQNLSWSIYYWIGASTSLDKKACAAIHAVNLRNFLGAQCRTVREEENDESPEFLELFGGHIVVHPGSRTASGFYTVEEMEYTTRLYRLSAKMSQLHVEAVPVDVSSLDPRYVFVLDAGRQIFVWNGRKSKNTMVSKGRLLAEKINKNERKNAVEVITLNQASKDMNFWRRLGIRSEEDIPEVTEIIEHVPDTWHPKPPRLYQVCLGMGYLELPQIEPRYNRLTQNLLETKNVYILDCYCDIYVWLGKKSTRLVRAAALKLSQELLRMIERPSHSMVNRSLEGTEAMVFKTNFVGWDDVIAVDFTRTAASVARTGADLKKWMQTQETKTDLSALFTPRQASMTIDEANQLMEEWNDDLEAMEAFVLEGKKFVKLPDEELGHFYSGDCYVFLCRYYVPPAAEVVPGGGGEGKRGGGESDASEGEGERGEGEEYEEEEDDEENFTCVVYFWQGRDAGNMGWLTFTFQLQKKFETLFGEKLEVLRTHQQQENLKFLSHFKRQFIIHKGSRKVAKQGANMGQVELFHLRANGGPIATRCIQVTPNAALLNSAFCYILKVPFDKAETQGTVYVWIGDDAPDEDIDIAEKCAKKLYDMNKFNLTMIPEGEEPENFFWVGMGGKKDYEKDASFMQHTRLFRCSNEKGYFSISEKCSDFCQDDLADDDIMILDSGTHVFIWVGSKCSEVEVKLAYKSAQVYVQHLRAKYPDQPRKLMLTVKGKETQKFTKCFHGWGAFKSVAA